MLVIPAIELKSDRCVRTISVGPHRDGLVYSNEPASMALLWRRENAKTLHVLDRDGLYDCNPINREAILEVVSTIEIPVQLVACFATAEECEEWLKGGVYRIFLHDLIQREPEAVKALLERYGPSRICAGAITRDGHISTTWRPLEETDTVEFALAARALGIKRAFFTDRNYEGVLRGPNFDELRRLATATHMQITAAGGVATVEHLWMLQEMECLGIDSVVIGRAFYENSFPCQELWRDIELERRRGDNGWTNGVSTSTLVNGNAIAPKKSNAGDRLSDAHDGGTD
jgi:phosphoribosylformimino-5-aminoimidazole carboxamide ribotide isomerase